MPICTGIKNLFSRSTILGSAGALTLVLASLPAFAAQTIEEIPFADKVIQLQETDEGEQQIVIGEQVLGKNYFAGFDRVIEVEGIRVALFYLGDGGNACGPSTLIVWHDDEGKLQSVEYDEDCATPAPAVSDNGIYFVPYLAPGEAQLMRRWSPSRGFSVAGKIAYAPEIGTGWENLSRDTISHPLDLFQNEAIYNAANQLLGDDLRHFATGLRVASQPRSLENGVLMASGCIPHSCGSGDSFIAVNASDKSVHMAQQSDEGYTFWPKDFAQWPQAAVQAFDIYKSSRQ